MRAPRRATHGEATVVVEVTDESPPIAVMERGSPDTDWFAADPAEVCMFNRSTGYFVVSKGCHIKAYLHSAANDNLVRLFILGPLTALVLHQRGLLVMHASAVAVDGSACLFVGSSGRGKSTTAAVMHAQGYPIVTDDVLAIGFGDDGTPFAFPGMPQLRIRSEIAAQLGFGNHMLPPVFPGFDELLLSGEPVTPSAPLPIQRVYVLDWSHQTAVDDIAPVNAFASVVVNSYVNQDILAQTETAAAHFRACHRLTQTCPVKLLPRRRSVRELDILASAIADDLGSPLAAEAVGAGPDLRF